MADDNSQRAFRNSDYSRSASHADQSGGQVSGHANDPLAELARLIGQNDPFAEFGRKTQPAAPAPQAHPVQHQDWAPQPYAAPAPEPQPVYDQAAPGYDSNAYYADDGYEQAETEYDDVPPRRRWKVLAVAAVVGLAVVGTAGAVGYRALFGSTGSSPPPVIKADATPTKVVPPSKSDAQSNKMIYDRVGERGSAEKLVSREEQPIDIPKPAPNALMPNTGPAAASIAPADQPKKIHTIVIRPDQPPAAAEPPAPQPRAATAPASSPSPPPRAPAPRAAAPQRLASAPPVATADAEEAAPVPKPAPPVQRAAAPRNAPLSLTPGAQAAPPPEPVRTASTPPHRAAPAPVAAASGQYAVQVSSQRSEAEAQTAFRTLQAKYPSQLGGRQPIIRRADLGSKGVYYRAMVGPFASSGDASSLCQSLKSAGGSCLIQKN